MKRKPPTAQPALSLGPLDTAAAPVARPTSEGPPFGPMPRKPGDLFLCSGCQKLVPATKDGRATVIQLGNHPTSVRVVWLSCSKRCANKMNFCGSCEVFGHTREDGPDVCPRWYSGRRMRSLKLYRCHAHDLVHDYKLAAEGKSSFRTGSPSEQMGKLLVEHNGDFAKVRAIVEDLGSDRLMLIMERVERDDPLWGAAPSVETPESIARDAKKAVDGHRALLVRQRGVDHSWTLERSTPVLLDDREKMARRTHAAQAYGSRATTEDATRVLVPFLQHEDSSMRACAAWGLFKHRTPEVRAAMLAQAEEENVPRLKAILEEMARSE